MNRFISILFFTFSIHFCSAQESKEINLIFIPVDMPDQEFKKLVNYQSNIRDSIGLYREMQDVRFQLLNKSYLACSFDSVVIDSSEVKVFVHAGESYHWLKLRPGNVDEEILSRTGYRDKIYNNSKINYKQLNRLLEKIIVLYENTGYPFASVVLDSLEINNNEVSASLKVKRNNLIRVDSVIIYGNSKVASKYIYNYLGIQPGDIYQEKIIKRINNRIDELSFVGQTKPHNVAFTAKTTLLNLYLEKRNANRFDGIIGVLPNEDNGKVEFTGDVKFRLLNSFNRGELINFNWRRLVNQSQDLKFKFNYPYLFNTPFGVDFDFKLYRRDTTFLDIYMKYGIQYLWNANNYIEVYINDKNSNLLSTSQYENSNVLPSFADISSTLYGIAINYQRLDYRLNPRKGYAVFIEAEAGTKKIRKNNDLKPEIYDGLDLKTNLYNVSSEIDFYFPLSRLMVINLGNQSAYTFNENIFENELYRIGGLLILRGFDEESIFTSAYSVSTFEYRIILEKNSYWYLFFDGAYYENRNVSSTITTHDTPIGFGTGINFQTNAGIFSLNYALGKQFDNPIIFRAAKIHFGFVNYF